MGQLAIILPDGEQEIRLRLIILLRLLGMYRGVDLAHAHRNVKTSSQPWMLYTKRKNRRHYGWYPVPQVEPRGCNPQYWLQKYIQCTSDFSGPQLFVSLRCRARQRAPISEDTINGMTTRFLREQGLGEWSAHSTRGACATALLHRGVEPAIVQALGDWESTECFNKFYNRLRATKSDVVQCLVPTLP